MFTTLARKMFGTQNDRIIKGFRQTVAKINALEPGIQSLSDTELAAQTDKFRGLLAGGKTLDDILPEAFATVREVSRRKMGQRHFDVQMMGGIALHQGYIPEMRTGEGKTLTATLAVYLNALEGKGVHVVTVNDYLAQRDANWMSPIYQTLGMSVGFILSNITDEMRRASYACDITYGTNNEFGFDYLRDNMKYSLEEMVQRPFNFAIVDEVDSILIDEARTPLIISGQAQDSADAYRVINKVIPKLIDADYEVDLKHKTVMLTDQGNNHVEEILTDMGILKEGGMYDAHNISIVHHVNQALRAHKLFSADVDYIVKDDAVIIIDEFTGRMMEGRRFSEGLHQALEAKEGVKIQHENQILASITFQNYFRMYPKLSGMTGTALTEKAEFEAIYNLSVVEIPTNQHMVRKDQHDEIYRTAAEKYDAIVKQIEQCRDRNQPVLVGTTSIEKSELLSRHLKKLGIEHQVLNARYHEQEASIIGQAGRPGAITIATNMAGRGTDIKLGGNAEMRIAAEVPADADELTRARKTERIKAEVAEAYDTVIAAGGLFVLGSERHESRRIDNQLRGRAGRQGDPGASKFFISLEDELMRIFGSEKMDVFLQKMGLKPGQPIIHPWINTAIERAQKKVEAQHFEIRKQLLRFDNVMNDQRKVIYDQRREIMSTEDAAELVADMRAEVVNDIVANAIPAGSYAEQWDVQLLKTDANRLLGLHIPAEEWAKEEGVDEHVISKRLAELAEKKISEKSAIVIPEQMRAIEKTILLQLLDQTWKEHLLGLEYLRQGIMLRAYGQKDPLNEYKTEAFAMFHDMLNTLRERVTAALCKIEFHSEAPPEPPRPTPPKMVQSRGPDPARVREPMDTTPLPAGSVDFRQDDPATWTKTPRNSACPCGSGKKYKYCHGTAE
ncbi:MAG TPA: preprotein translocase subunit SecA [Patescibacteria group bacterium]|nr:preprotein translocase subunit SecA [Patescibacteria group bacterium]